MMQFYRPSDIYYGEFTTSRFDTGAAANADSLPVATATKNGVDDAAFVLTVVNIDTGRYKITGTVPAGYVTGDRVQVSVSATVNSVAGKGVVDTFQVVAASSGIPILHSDGKVLLGGTTHTASVIPTVTDVSTKTGYSLNSVYDAAKTAAPVGAAMTLTGAYDAAKTAAPVGAAMTLTGAYDAAKTAAQAGTAMTLTGAYDAAKTAAQAGTALSNMMWTNSRAAYLDWLNISGLVASKADIESITQSLRVRVILPSPMTRMKSVSIAYRVWIYSYNELHQAEDLDSSPIISVENNSGTDRSANLSAVTKPIGTTGQYYADYTIAITHDLEGLVFKVAATEGAVTTNYAASTIVVEEGAGSELEENVSNIKAVTDVIDSKLPTSPYLAGSDDSNGSIGVTGGIFVGG